MSVEMRCPRCKQPLGAGDVEALADVVLGHLREAHRHAPPREHVLSRITRLNDGAGR